MLRELETFLAIARHGSFSAAGERIGLTQSAVSAQIKRLEDDLRTPLFDRNGRAARLNDAGRGLVAMAGELLLSYEQMRERLRGNASGGAIRIGAIPTAQIGLLPDALVAFRAQCPGTMVHIAPGTSAQLLDRLDADELDLAIVIRPPFSLPKQLGWEPLLSEPYVLIAPANVRARQLSAVLAQHPFIRYDRLSYGGRPVQRYLTQHGIAVTDSMELKELEAIVRMVERGLGVSIIPRSKLLSLPRRNVRVISLGKSTFHREIGVADAGGQRRTSSVTALIASLQRAARRVS
jgi:DNA-binding transcriptional LysR family regulator